MLNWCNSKEINNTVQYVSNLQPSISDSSRLLWAGQESANRFFPRTHSLWKNQFWKNCKFSSVETFKYKLSTNLIQK